MPDIESLYKKVDGKILIEIKLSSINQLFNSFDPAPFHEKELDTAAEHYIVDTVDDFPQKTQFKIIIYLPHELAASDRAKTIAPAIQNHFQYKALVAERKFRSRFKYGRFTLLIGLTFLFISLLIGQYVLSVAASIVTQVIATALMVTGWAAMWEPVTVLLYELRPIIQRKNTYLKISRIEIEVLPLPA